MLARRGFRPGRERGRAVTDTVAALAAGAQCLSDVEAMTAQVELFGPAGRASATTVLRVLCEYADRLGGDGASHGLIDNLHALNTAAVHGARGRRLEYSIGWPVDARTRTAIEATAESDWAAGLTASGRAEEQSQVIELTGLLRHSHPGDLLSGWPADIRIFGRRTPPLPGEQAELGQDPNLRYGAVATNTPTGHVQHLDVRHRTQAHVEDRIKEPKACGGTRLPSTFYDRNSAWLHLA